MTSKSGIILRIKLQSNVLVTLIRELEIIILMR